MRILKEHIQIYRRQSGDGRNQDFDLDNNTLRSEKNAYHYDYLVLAMGSSPNFCGISGLEEHAFTLWSFDDAVRIREHIKKTFILAEQERIRKREKGF